MSVASDAIRNVKIVWRLAWFDASAIDSMEDSPHAFWRSFWALPLVLIMDATVSGLTLTAFSEVHENVSRSPFAAGWLIVGWMLGLNISADFARHMKKSEHWPRYVVAHNWASLVQGMVFSIGVLVLSAIGAPADVYGLWVVMIGFWSLTYDWFIVKATLKVGGPPAALLMAVLLFAALFMSQVAGSFVNAS
jgi:hypothetical protein